MNNKIKIFFLSIITTLLSSSFSSAYAQQKDKNKDKVKAVLVKEDKVKTKVAVLSKKDSLKTKEIKEITEIADSVKTEVNLKFKFYKRNAHASYYAQKFHGRRTASGARFDNTKYTAAHKKLPFGTKVRVTNEVNGKSVIVEITDRGPFSKVREIDLTKKAFMELADNKNSGAVIVKLEVEAN